MADGFVGNQSSVDQSTVYVDTAGELSAEQVDAHNAEYEPEDEADEHHVKDGGNRLNQCVHDHLHSRQQH